MTGEVTYRKSDTILLENFKRFNNIRNMDKSIEKKIMFLWAFRYSGLRSSPLIFLTFDIDVVHKVKGPGHE
jgi:hypothetical protein